MWVLLRLTTTKMHVYSVNIGKWVWSRFGEFSKLGGFDLVGGVKIGWRFGDS